MTRSVEIFFDYSSPYAYLGTTQIEHVASESGATVIWRPFLLGALFRTIGTPLIPLQAMPEPKRRYQGLELLRWAKHWGVDFRFNTHFPLRTVTALRLTHAVPDENRSELVHAMMRAAWVEDRDINDPRVMTEVLDGVGLEEAWLEKASELPAKQALRATTDDAVSRGVPGAPTCIVDGEVYWGQDRFHFVQAALAGRPLGMT